MDGTQLFFRVIVFYLNKPTRILSFPAPLEMCLDERREKIKTRAHAERTHHTLPHDLRIAGMEVDPQPNGSQGSDRCVLVCHEDESCVARIEEWK